MSLECKASKDLLPVGKFSILFTTLNKFNKAFYEPVENLITS